jgi:glycosyltransferase involved in cell wall biosynthesis
MSADVSVVIPAYNAARFIAEAIDSALAQTWPPREVIVVDDGSTDDTAAVVAGFGERVTYVRQANARQAAARNRGVHYSTTEVLAFLDADDVWRKEKLARQLAVLDRSPAVGAVTCSMQEIGVDGRLGAVRTAGARGRCYRQILLGQVPIGAGSTWVVRRAVFTAVGGFGETLSPCEDTDFAWRAATLTDLESVEEPLVLYRIHGANTHSNVDLTTSAWRKLYRGAFAHPDVRRQSWVFRARCRGRLNYMLAGDHLRARRLGLALSFGVRAALSWPPTVGRMASRLVRRGAA